MNFDPAAVFRTLVDAGVRFVLIGGLAGREFGSTTVTNDVDICYDREPDNLERLVTALRAMNARLRGLDEDVPFVLDARTLRNGDTFTFQTDYGAVDVLGTPSGTSGYADLAAGAWTVEYDTFSVQVVALDDLIRMKRAAARVKDRSEVEILLALRDQLRES